ncbi:MAG TPA: porin [Gemmatimonadales bacterium]|nr:porin [Gemmatimonadales bacterium]
MHPSLLQRSLTVAVMASGIAGLPLPGGLSGQAPAVRVAGRAQIQYRLAGGDSSANFSGTGVTNGFEVRRLRIEASARLADNVTVSVMPSFEMGQIRMRDAWVRVELAPRLGLTLGQEKSPFQRYELTSSNSLPSIERGVRILGLTGREALNDVIVNNGYGSQDLGAFLDWTAPGNRIALKAGVSNGSRESAADVNNAKSFFARASATVVTNGAGQPALQVGASLAARDRAICQSVLGTGGCGAYYADSSKITTAVGLDLEWGGFRPGWHVIADFATGDNVPLPLRLNSGRNTANLRNSADSNLATFWGLHAVAAYRVVTRGADTRLVQMLEPALRLDYTDPDTDTPDDEGLLITPVLNLYFASTAVLRAGLDLYWYPGPGGDSRAAREFKISWQANF